MTQRKENHGRRGYGSSNTTLKKIRALAQQRRSEGATLKTVADEIERDYGVRYTVSCISKWGPLRKLPVYTETDRHNAIDLYRACGSPFKVQAQTGIAAGTIWKWAHRVRFL